MCRLAVNVLNSENKIIFFDTETTGLSAETDRIIQLAAIGADIEENLPVEKEQMLLYINPQRNLDPFIMNLTGITDEMLADKPDEQESWAKIYEFFGDTPVICAHNAMFDVNMMKALYQRNGKVFAPTIIDTLTMARELMPKEEAGNHKQETLLNYFGLGEGLRPHDAMDDTRGLIRLFRHLTELYLEKANRMQCGAARPRIKSSWSWSGLIGVKGGSRAYVKRLYMRLDMEDRIIFVSLMRPYGWGEKHSGTLEKLDMEYMEQQLLKRYRCDSMEQLAASNP